MIRTSRRRVRVAIAATSVGLLALTAACSSDSKTSTGSSSGSSAASSSAAADVLGAEKKATGTPGDIGFVSDGKSGGIDNPPELQAAKAAVEYVNTYENGLNGHVINLITCERGQTPSGATACGTKMVDAKVAAVLNGVSGQSASIFSGLGASGIPFVGYGNIDQ